MKTDVLELGRSAREPRDGQDNASKIGHGQDDASGFGHAHNGANGLGDSQCDTNETHKLEHGPYNAGDLG